jgi:Zn-dependent protease with chaperone function
MTGEQFAALVRRLEGQAKADPAGYQTRVVLLAALGSAYVVAILALVIAIFLALIASVLVLKSLGVQLVIAFGFFLWMILKALWVQMEAPTGEEIRAGDAPELFALIERMRRELGAPAFHHVLITDDFNAAVVQAPRLGLLGGSRNYLILGLPLMQALTVEQFSAVLAHELGHLARGHGRVSNWIYRQRLRWSRLLEVLEANESRGSFLFKPFLGWFAPYFSAYSFPMARANEYEADATSVRLSSPEAAAEALTGVSVIGSYLAERYWPQIHRQADELPHPSFAPYGEIGPSVAAHLDAESAQTWLGRALAEQPSLADTHPTLSERLAAIGQPPRLSPPGPGQAAGQLLGPALPGLTERFDRRWQEQIAPSWRDRYQRVQEGRQALAALAARVERGEDLPLRDAFERARLTDSIGGDPDGALAQLRALRERAPDDAVLLFTLGAQLLSRNDPEGVALVERAMQLDEDAIAPGAEQLRDYHWRGGRREEAHDWHARMQERAQLLDAAARERGRIALSDALEPHGLSDAAIEDLRAQLRAIPGLRRAYLVRKRVQHQPHRPCYVLGFGVTGPLQIHSEPRARAALQQIQERLRFPGEALILSVEGKNYRFGWRLWRMRGARIL